MIRQIIIPKEHSAVERYFWNLLKNRELCGYRFKRQQGFGKYIVDFYCDELKLAIELDAENSTLRTKYDIERERFLSSLNITLIRLGTSEIRSAWKSFIRILINNNSKPKNNIL